MTPPARLLPRPRSSPTGAAVQPMRIGSVSFLNARPLIAGLEDDAGIDLQLEVPSRLLDGLIQRRYDTALLPVIDYQRLAGLTILQAGGIASDGETLTVRIFSRCPLQQIRVLGCDPDSHTSVALARVLLMEQFAIRPEFRDLHDSARDACEAMLLIGDKVVCDAPSGFEHQLDLGAAWKELTGLPFVFAVWMTRQDRDLATLHRTLDRARRQGMREIDSIIAEHARPRGWPTALAKKYLTQHLSYSIGPREILAIRRFHELSYRHSVLEQPPRDLEIFHPDNV